MTLLALQISTVVHLVCCEECETAANRKMVSDAYRTCIGIVLHTATWFQWGEFVRLYSDPHKRWKSSHIARRHGCARDLAQAPKTRG